MDKTFKELIMAGFEKKNDEIKTATQ
jgi:hypothetical protein